MVITDIPFQSAPLKYQRYADIIKLKRDREKLQEEQPQDAEELRKQKAEEYAGFLVSKDRSCGPDGFLDSARYTHTYSVPKLVQPSSAPAGLGGSRNRTSVGVTRLLEEERRQHERHMKAIESHMWSYKQQERELKRQEGDIKKEQLKNFTTSKDIETSIHRQRYENERELGRSLQKYSDRQNDHIHRKEQVSKERLKKSVMSEMLSKGQDRRYQLTKSDLSKLFARKQEEIGLKQQQLEQIMAECQKRVEINEAEQFKLKNELMELAISLNMEAQKARERRLDMEQLRRAETTKAIETDLKNQRALEDKLAKGEQDVRNALQKRRKLSSDYTTSGLQLSEKARDTGRALLETQNQLAENVAKQEDLGKDVQHRKAEMRVKEIEHKIQEHVSKRQQQLESKVNEKRDRDHQQEDLLAEKFNWKSLDTAAIVEEDNLKHLKRIVDKDDELEQRLYQTVQQAEQGRQKQDRLLQQLAAELDDVKRENQYRLNEESRRLQRREDELGNKIRRHQAMLDKLHANREFTYMSLQNHRAKSREEKFQMQRCQQSRDRLFAIRAKTDPMLVMKQSAGVGAN